MATKDLTLREFESLRQESMQWQRIRFTVFAGAVALFTAVSASTGSFLKTLSWHIPSAIILAVLSCAAIITWMCTRFATRIGTYIEVFIENKGWESRSREFRKGRKSPLKIIKMSIGFSLLYTLLASAQIVIAITICEGPVSNLSLLVVIIIGILFIISNLLLALRSYPRKAFIARWLEVKKAEQNESRGIVE